MYFHVQFFEKSGCERIDMSVTKKHQEFAVLEVKNRRGRPAPPSLKSCGDGLGTQLKYSFYFFYAQTLTFAQINVYTQFT